MTDTVRICPHCKLVYRPDERIYQNAETVCPKCGKPMTKEKDK